MQERPLDKPGRLEGPLDDLRFSKRALWKLKQFIRMVRNGWNITAFFEGKRGIHRTYTCQTHNQLYAMSKKFDCGFTKYAMKVGLIDDCFASDSYTYRFIMAVW